MTEKLLSRTGEDCDRVLFLDIETLPDFDRLHLFNLGEKPCDRIQLDRCPDPRDTIMGETGNKPADIIEVDLKNLFNSETIPPSEWFDNCRSVEVDLGKSRVGVKKLIDKYQKMADAHETSYDDAIRKLSLGVDTCRVLSVAFAMGNEDVKVLYANPEEPNSEYELLVEFWNQAEQATHFFAYNGCAFDLPIILTRSAFLKVPPTRLINLNPWNGDVIDPLNLRPSAKQKDVVDFNMIAERDDDEMHGGKVYDYYLAGKHKEIKKYNICDVKTMRDLFVHFSGYFWM